MCCGKSAILRTGVIQLCVLMCVPHLACIQYVVGWLQVFVMRVPLFVAGSSFLLDGGCVCARSSSSPPPSPPLWAACVNGWDHASLIAVCLCAFLLAGSSNWLDDGLSMPLSWLDPLMCLCPSPFQCLSVWLCVCYLADSCVTAWVSTYACISSKWRWHQLFLFFFHLAANVGYRKPAQSWPNDEQIRCLNCVIHSLTLSLFLSFFILNHTSKLWTTPLLESCSLLLADANPLHFLWRRNSGLRSVKCFGNTWIFANSSFFWPSKPKNRAKNARKSIPETLRSDSMPNNSLIVNR